MQRGPHQCGIHQAGDQRADRKRPGADVGREKEGREERAEDAVDCEQRQNDDSRMVSAEWRRAQVGMLSMTLAIEPMTH